MSADLTHPNIASLFDTLFACGGCCATKQVDKYLRKSSLKY